MQAIVIERTLIKMRNICKKKKPGADKLRRAGSFCYPEHKMMGVDFLIISAFQEHRAQVQFNMVTCS